MHFRHMQTKNVKSWNVCFKEYAVQQDMWIILWLVVEIFGSPILIFLSVQNLDSGSRVHVENEN